MHELYELKDRLCDELTKYAGQGISAGTLEVVDKLTHTIKNLDKIIDKKEEEEYSGTYPYARDTMTGRSYRDGMYAYTRGRGRNAKRDSMGRYASEGGYSRNEEMVSKLYAMMNEAPDENTRREIENVARKIEMM